MNLIEYRDNKYSQNGEDGIIGEICRRLGIAAGWFVEFGAWDGKNLSNCYNLVAHHGWSGVFIEGNPQKYEDLLKTQAGLIGKYWAVYTDEINGFDSGDMVIGTAWPVNQQFTPAPGV